MSNVFYAIFVSIFWTDGASHSLFCKFKYKKCIFVLCAFRFFRHIDAVPKASYVPFGRTHRPPSAGQGRFRELWECPADTPLFSLYRTSQNVHDRRTIRASVGAWIFSRSASTPVPGASADQGTLPRPENMPPVCFLNGLTRPTSDSKNRSAPKGADLI